MSDAPDPRPPAPPGVLPAGLNAGWAEFSHDLLALSDSEGRIGWANPAFRERTGMAGAIDAGFDGANLMSLVAAGPQGDAGRSALMRALRGEPMRDADIALRDANGTPLWVRARTLACDGVILWILKDITQQTLSTRQSERLSELLDIAREFGRLGIWEREIPSGKGQWDSHVFRFWGLDPGEAVPDFKVAVAQIHPADRLLVRTTYEGSTRQAGSYSQRYRLLNKDGSVRWLQSQWKVKEGASGRPEKSIGVLMDDTDAFELARSLTDAMEQLRMAVELGHIAIWRHDLKTQLMHYNDRAYEVLGIPPRPEGIPIDEVRAIIHPDDLPRVVASAQQTLLTGKPTDFEARYRRVDGSWRHIMTRRVVQLGPTGEPLAFLGVGLDLTEHLDALAAIRSADERAALATRSAGIGTWEVDIAQGIERWDTQMFVLRGISPREHPPSRDERLAMVHPADLHLLLDSQRQAMDSDEPSQYEFRVVLPDGTCRWLASRSIPVRNAQGRTVRRVGVNWDISESRNAQVILQEKALAERESRAKSQFLSRMSHELRTPLNAVLGFTQLLLEQPGTALGQAERSKLGHIRDAGDHLLSLINDVLELSSLEAGNLRLDLQPVDLGKVVAQAVPLVESLAAQWRVTVRIDGTGTVDKVQAWADPTRMLQVMLNLLSNAIKYNRPQGDVTISLGATESGSWVRVADTGRGLTPEQMSHLFEPFNRLGIERDGIEGTGIGLVIVKALVESMGGTVSVASQPGSGTSFELTLPRPMAGPDEPAAPSMAPGPPEAPAPGPNHERRGRVLYIEDNPINVLLVEELVASVGGLKLVSVATGDAGVQRAIADRPDLVLVDMQLPDFDGFEVLRRLRGDARTASIPCIALSANAMPQDIAQALAAGFEDYWTKPIDFKAFVAALERLFPARPPTQAGYEAG